MHDHCVQTNTSQVRTLVLYQMLDHFAKTESEELCSV
jgi:hypothetical protein